MGLTDMISYLSDNPYFGAGFGFVRRGSQCCRGPQRRSNRLHSVSTAVHDDGGSDLFLMIDNTLQYGEDANIVTKDFDEYNDEIPTES